MNVFEAVKGSLSTRQVAEYYGLKVNRNGMVCCPFHNDKNPSMKVDKRYHCFACRADGDVIDYVSGFYGLGKKDAAIKIADDFGISYERWKPPDRKQEKAVMTKPLPLRFEEAKSHFFKMLTDHYHLLCSVREVYAPTDPDGEWDVRFAEAVHEITKLEYVMDTFLNGDMETQVDIINDYGRKIADYERRDKELAAGKAGSIGTDNIGNGDDEGEAA